MRNMAIAVLMIALAGGIVRAEERNFTPKDRFCVMDKTPQATEPLGAVIETAGVFAGKIASAVEIAFTGERKITVENETGECRIFPFCEATKITDNAFNAVTFNRLKKGEKVKVHYVEEGGAEKVESVIVDTGVEKVKETAVQK